MATKTKTRKAKTNKPTIDGVQKPKEVEERKKKAKVKVTPPPETPILFIGDIKNPLLDNARMKRALCVALARETENDDLLVAAVRASGVLQKKGLSYEHIDLDFLNKAEHSGRGYAINCGRKMQNTYKDTERVNECKDFAAALVAAVSKEGEMEKLQHETLDKYKEYQKQVKEELAKSKKDKPKKKEEKVTEEAPKEETEETKE